MFNYNQGMRVIEKNILIEIIQRELLLLWHPGIHIARLVKKHSPKQKDFMGVLSR